MPAKVKSNSELLLPTKKGAVSQKELLHYMSDIGLKSHKQDPLPRKVKLDLPHKKVKNEIQRTNKKKRKKSRNIFQKIGNKSSKPENIGKVNHVTKSSHTRSQPDVSAIKQIKTPRILNDSLWHEMKNSLFDSLNLKSNDKTKVPEGMLQEAELLLSRDTVAYKLVQEKTNRSDHEWIKNILLTGTLSDKYSAHVLLIQESPIHNLTSLSALLNLAGKNEKRVALGACDSLRQLWCSTLLPDRKLKTFGENVVGLESLEVNQDRECALIFSLFEHKLKTYYIEFIKIIKRHAHDSVTEVKAKSIDYIFEMLAMKPEQEQILLTALVDKLSDPAKQVASKAQYLLFKLIHHHPNMKYVVCEEVERLLNRPNASEKAQRYGFNFLNQMVLTREDVELANKLLKIYFAFFQVYSLKKEANWKTLSSLLSGVQRTYPFSDLKDDKLFSVQISTLFKVVHVGTFSTSLQSLLFLLQIINTKPQIADRYYQALYSKILDREMVSSNKHTIFLNLMFRAFKSDSAPDRNKAFAKRLVQSTVFHRSNYMCGVLYLLEKLFQNNTSLFSLITESVARESEEETFRDLDSSEEESQEKNEPLHPTTPRYELRSRNPLYCRAGYSCLWEISLLEKHFHPSVRSFATQLRTFQKSEYEGDPLESFSVIRFLDKFVYKTPKKREQSQGISLMKKSISKGRVNQEPVNSAAFLSQKPDCIPQDEMFYYQYFKLQERKLNKKKRESADHLLTADDEDGDPSKGSTPNFMSDIKQKKNKRKEREYEVSSSSDSDVEFNVDGSDFGSSGDEFLEGGFNKEKYEKMLIQEANSDEERTTEQPDFDSSLFAAADEFSHLIEEGIDEETQYKKKSKKRPKIWVKPRENKKRKPLPKPKHTPKKKSNNSLRKPKFIRKIKP